MRHRHWSSRVAGVTVFLGVVLLALPVVGWAQDTTLVAKKVAAGPALDGKQDPAWQQAAPLVVKLNGGKNLPGGSTEVSLRALYDAEKVYFLAQWKVPAKGERRAPFQKQADGTWKQLKDPNDKGGDDNVYYEDKLAMIWAIKAPTFEKSGCFAGCHLGETKAFGNKYLPAGERPTSGTGSRSAPAASTRSTTSTSTTPSTTRRRPPRPAARATRRRGAATRTTNW